MRAAWLAILLVLPAAQALPWSAAPWEVTSDTTIEGVPLVVAQDVVVKPGGTLRLLGVDALVARDVRITVESGGALVIDEGASATSSATVPTRLVAATLPFDLVAQAGSSLLVRAATLSGARIATSASGALIEASALILSGGPVRVTGGDLTIEGGSLDASPASAASASPGATLRMLGVTVGQTGDYGVRADQATLVVESGAFAASGSYSVYARASSVRIADTTFGAHCGAFLVDGSTGELVRNDVRALDHGVTLISSPGVVVANNTFDGTQEALLLVDSDAPTRDNAFVSNGRGIVLVQSSPALDRNAFAQNQGGLEVLSGPSAPVLRDNSFEENVAFAVSNPQATPLDARWNWWGSASGPASGDLVGLVDAAPWLASAP